jgi:hypothetical protein
MASAELQSISMHHQRPDRQMCIIATALLALNLAFITGVCNFMQRIIVVANQLVEEEPD